MPVALTFPVAHRLLSRLPSPAVERSDDFSRRWSLRVLAFLVPLVAAGAQSPPRYDVLVRGGRVLDGTGNPWYYADVAITGDRIVALGNLAGATARRVVDARGLYVAPGFIDPHSHSGPGLATRELSGGVPLLLQGVTTVVVNPDGGGPVDLRAQRRQLSAARPGVNVALLVPHGSVRGRVLGMEDRAPTASELARMEALVDSGMTAGAFGLSSGPFYAPGSFAKTDELIALARVAAARGGVYTSHIRDESDYTIGVAAAVDEVIRIASEARLPGIVTHIKALGPHVWGMAPRLIARIDSARAQGVEVFADQYPYDASSTSLSAALVPRWAIAGGDSAFRRRLADPTDHARIEREMRDNLERRGGASRIQFARYGPDSSIEGRTLQQVADARREDPVIAALALLTRAQAGIVSFNMDSADVAAFMRQRWTMTSSDGDLVPMGRGVPHPRAYGTFPRKLRKYALDERVVELADAIRSMTTLPATVMRMEGRGQLRPGSYADVVVF
ncbi:MAG TPA: amidohydrolase family protein, partial [Gemmatimonadaceae bacterium]|nr:amidohydrolase family protein [Gemmatimonadaceae bacterium]